MPLLDWIHAGIYYSLFTLKYEMMKFGSFQPVKQLEGKDLTMKIDKLKKRLRKNRPMTTVSIRFPEDVIDDLKQVAPMMGFSGYQPLIRAYVGQGLRLDLERLDQELLPALVNNLKKRGINEAIIIEALAEASQEPKPQ